MSAPSVYPLIKNMRTYVSGRIDPRSGLALIKPAGTDPVHSIKRLSNDIPSLVVQNARIIGAGTNLYVQAALVGPLVQEDSGYSGNPLSLLQVRPPNSPEAWCYVGDSLKMSKVRADGTVFQWGIAPPLSPPSLTFGPDARQNIEDYGSISPWTNGGTAGAISLLARLTGASIQAIFYDGLTFGHNPPYNGELSMALLGVVSPIQPGSLFAISGEVLEAQNVYPGFTATVGSFSIASSIPLVSGEFLDTYTVHLIDVSQTPANRGYSPKMDKTASGTTGIRSSAGNSGIGISVGSIINCGVVAGLPGTIYGEVTGVTVGPDGSVAASVIFSSSHTPSSTPSFVDFIGLGTVRASSVIGHVPGEIVTQNSFAFQVTIGTGNISEVQGFDLSHVSTVEALPISRPVQDADNIHLSILMDNPQYLVEGKIFFDVDATTNDFQHNYFYKAFRQSDLQQAANSTETVLTARQGGLNTAVIDTFGGRGYPTADTVRVGPTTRTKRMGGGPVYREGPLPISFGPGGTVPVSTQAATGSSQWTELSFKVSDLTRVGNAIDRTLANVAAIRIQFQVNATLNIQLSSFWIGGSYGPDIGTTGSPYFYRSVARSSLTGAQSNPSPATMNGIEARNQGVLIFLARHPDSQVDLLDVYRWGGSLTNWLYVGSAPNAGNPQVEDVLQDLDIADAEQLAFDNFQPFPTIDLPKSGTCQVVGNKIIWVSGDQFNLQWAPGTIINVNGTNYTLYLQPSSTTVLFTVENGGTEPAVPFTISEATILGQPLPAVWGPFSQNSALFFFACGDLYQPGVLFLTKGNFPDSAPDVLQIEVTSPSEPLMNGCIYNGLPYAWSSARFYILYPTTQGGFIITAGQVEANAGNNAFIPQDIQNCKGLFARFFFAAGPGIPKIWYGADDGIYETTGGAAASITNEMLYLLFPHDGQPAEAVTLGSDTIQPPDFTQTSSLRLSYADGFLFFDYVDITGLPTTLVYDTITKVWSLDAYSLGAGKGVLTHYLEEGRSVHSLLAGGSDSNLYQMSGTADNGNAYICKLKMPQGPDSGTYQHIRDCYLGLISTGTPTLVVNIDGTDYKFVLETTGGTYEKIYQVLAALKGKLFSWGVTNEFETTPTPFSIFRNDAIVRTKEWGSTDKYQGTNPFADLMKRSKIQVGT